MDDRAAATAVARQVSSDALDERLIEQYGIDPSSPDFAKRLRSARKAHFTSLALKSARSRRKAAGDA